MRAFVLRCPRSRRGRRWGCLAVGVCLATGLLSPTAHAALSFEHSVALVFDDNLNNAGQRVNALDDWQLQFAASGQYGVGLGRTTNLEARARLQRSQWQTYERLSETQASVGFTVNQALGEGVLAPTLALGWQRDWIYSQSAIRDRRQDRAIVQVDQVITSRLAAQAYVEWRRQRSDNAVFSGHLHTLGIALDYRINPRWSAFVDGQYHNGDFVTTVLGDVLLVVPAKAVATDDGFSSADNPDRAFKQSGHGQAYTLGAAFQWLPSVTLGINAQYRQIQNPADVQYVRATQALSLKWHF